MFQWYMVQCYSTHLRTCVAASLARALLLFTAISSATRTRASARDTASTTPACNTLYCINNVNCSVDLLDSGAGVGVEGGGGGGGQHGPGRLPPAAAICTLPAGGGVSLHLGVQ